MQKSTVTLDQAVILGEVKELRKTVEDVRRALEELKQRVVRTEADLNVIESGYHVIYNALEINGLMSAGEPTVPAKTQKSQKEPTAAVKEETFTLTFEDKQGEKLGQYAIAFKKSNLSDKFQSAYNILRQTNATISKRYCGTGYVYSYWLYNSDDRIFRQKLKQKVEGDKK